MAVSRPSYVSLFRYATPVDLASTLAGCLAATATGASTPLFAWRFGEMLSAFYAPDASAQINRACLIILGIGGAVLLTGTLQTACLVWAGSRQASRVRRRYLAALLQQDMRFFDTHAASGLLHTLREEAVVLQEAMSDKLGAFIQGVVCFVGGMVLAFLRAWDLSLVILAAIPALVIVGGVCAMLTARLQARASLAYSRAGGIAAEALSSMRTVAAFGREEAVLRAYAAELAGPQKLGERQGVLKGLSVGASGCIFFGAYALALWFGAQRVADGRMDGGTVVSVLTACVWGGFALGQAMPLLSVFQEGRVAAASLFAVCERTSADELPPRASDASAAGGADGSTEGSPLLPESIKGDLELVGVHFFYPARPQRLVLQGLSLVLPAGKSTALVGESGCGKSTVVQLLLRLYEPATGAVLLDGRDVRSLPLAWLRSQVGLVAQTPALFASTIFENIALDSGASMERVVQASMAANAHGFICKLPQGYDTRVGEKGSNLSGGQTQRIAIARAILRNPQVLLLDEATSALDASCEKAVQSALEALGPGRTCISVAHRLSTVVQADVIHVLRQGALVETGTHRQLVELGGVYASMAAKQALKFGDEDADSAEEGGREQGGGKGGADATAQVKNAGPRGKGVKPRTLRESILRRGSVRLSIIPLALKEKLAAGGVAAGGASAGADGGGALRRLAVLNRPEWRHLLLGLLCSTALGLTFPGFSVAISEVVSDLWLPDASAIRAAGSKWGLVFTGIALGCLMLRVAEGWAFAVAGQRLALRVRVLMLRALLRQDFPFFDVPENSSGALLSSLSADAASVRGALGDRAAHVLYMLSCMVAAYVIAFMNSWSMALVVTATMPLLVAAEGIQAKIKMGQQELDRSALEASDAVAAEAVGCIKAVAAFNMQACYLQLYSQRLRGAAPGWSALTSGLSFGSSHFLRMATCALCFWFGGTQVAAGNLEFRQMLTAFWALYYASMGLAGAQNAFPDLAKAAAACRRVFAFVDHPSASAALLPDGPASASAGVDPVAAALAAAEGRGGPRSAAGGPQPAAPVGAEIAIQGDVELRRVAFAYPQRPERLILKEFSLTVPAGTSCALVGESGHGKSTIIGLLERFYEPLDGGVLVDGISVKTLSLRCLRAQMALVGQEPVMFSGTIRDNLALSTGASLEEATEAATKANALGFIQALPDGFSTRLGDGGSALSGGQLQRLAVARAILRKPRILLLDEPTLALDSESERAVQAALDGVMVGRTTIMVAHRLSTVTQCTRIAAVYRGRVLEQGTHAQLLEAKRYYAHLWESSTAAQ